MRSVGLWRGRASKALSLQGIGEAYVINSLPEMCGSSAGTDVVLAGGLLIFREWPEQHQPTSRATWPIIIANSPSLPLPESEEKSQEPPYIS